MEKLFKNLFIFFIINLLIFLLLFFLSSYFFQKNKWYTDPNLKSVPANQNFDFIILGSSHAEVFSRYKNDINVKKILGKNFYSLALPGAGPVIEKIYLDYFYMKKNQTQKIIYFIDPFALYSKDLNESYPYLPPGNIDLQFIGLLIENHWNIVSALNYITSILSSHWITKPQPIDKNIFTKVGDIRDERIAKRNRYYYPTGIDQQNYTKYFKKFEEIILTAQQNNADIVFIIPPTLVKNDPGMENLSATLDILRQRYNIDYYDYSEVMTDHKYFFDMEHLNTDGVIYFTENYLKSIVK